MPQDFVPGLQLSRRFYREAVEPILSQQVPGLAHTAARLGSGSEVLGFDTARSADHEWGPRLQIFLRPHDADKHAADIIDALSERLPKTFLGYSTNFVPAENDSIRHMQITDGRVFHRVDVTDLDTWFGEHLGFDPRAGVTVRDWLATPTQTLAETTAGAVFHDGLDELEPSRLRLAWYPIDVWRYVLAHQWQRIAHEEAFVGRCGEVGDELGSAVVCSRLVRELMRLCLLMARRYPPYSKWLGSSFAEAPCAAELTPVLTSALASTDWHDREGHLATAYESVGALHNQLELTAEVDPRTRAYHDRPYRVLHAERFTAALLGSIADESVRALPPIGAIDQYVDSTDVLCHRSRTRALAAAGGL